MFKRKRRKSSQNKCSKANENFWWVIIKAAIITTSNINSKAKFTIKKTTVKKYNKFKYK